MANQVYEFIFLDEDNELHVVWDAESGLSVKIQGKNFPLSTAANPSDCFYEWCRHCFTYNSQQELFKVHKLYIFV